jgi:hypothetical protein
VDIKTQAYGPSHLHLDMLMDSLVPQLKVSTLIIQQDWATWGHILSTKHFDSDRVNMANIFNGFSGLCFEGFVNIKI